MNWLSKHETTLKNAGDRKVIAMEVRNLRDQIQSLANSRDTNGQYIFAGFKVDAKPFVAEENGDIVHAGDRGIHALQISDNQRISTSLDGADVFLRCLGMRVSNLYFQV